MLNMLHVELAVLSVHHVEPVPSDWLKVHALPQRFVNPRLTLVFNHHGVLKFEYLPKYDNIFGIATFHQSTYFPQICCAEVNFMTGNLQEKNFWLFIAYVIECTYNNYA